MERLALNIDPYANEPGHWGTSLVNNAEILVACLNAAKARSVIEVGAYAGDLTRLLLEWAATAQARVWAIDPAPQEQLLALDRERDDLELVRATSDDGLMSIPPPDAAIIDGDHNYFTVSEELRIIGEHAEGGLLPLLIFHDVCWPHARRDDYFAPDRIPEDCRQPTVEGGGLFPGEPGVRPGGLPFKWSAAREGGPRNGVLTAVEDFVADRDGLRLAVIPAFFGLGVVWSRDAPWADDVAEVLEPWDANPLVERMEENRVLHLASAHFQMVQLALAQQRIARQEELLRKLLESKTFALAERLSALRQGGRPAFSKDEVRRVLGD